VASEDGAGEVLLDLVRAAEQSEKQAREETGRSLNVATISRSYGSVRRQGERGASEVIDYPTLEVRDPNELRFSSPVQIDAFAEGPVYRGENQLSTKDIEEKIKEINAVELGSGDEDELEIPVESIVDEIEELTDIGAAEIVEAELEEEFEQELEGAAVLEAAEEIEELTNLAAAEIVEEELEDALELEELELEELTDLAAAQIVEEELEREINELTDVAAAEIVAEEIADQLEEELEEISELTDLAAAELVTEELAEDIIADIAALSEESTADNETEDIDFGEITEVVV